MKEVIKLPEWEEIPKKIRIYQDFEFNEKPNFYFGFLIPTKIKINNGKETEEFLTNDVWVLTRNGLIKNDEFVKLVEKEHLNLPAFNLNPKLVKLLVDAIERVKEEKINFATQQMFNIVILLPKILELELLEELIKDAKSVKYIKKYETTFDIRGVDRKEVLREIKLTKKEIEEKEKFLKDLEASGIVEIKDCKIDIKKVENLVKSGIELKDALILVQSNCLGVDYFVTRDGDILDLGSRKPKWLKLKIVKPRTMIEILSKEIIKSQS